MPETSETALLDGEVLAEIRAMESDGSSGFLRSLAEKYANNWMRDCVTLQDDIHQGDAESARKMTHRLSIGKSDGCGEIPPHSGRYQMLRETVCLYRFLKRPIITEGYSYLTEI